MVYGIVKQSGGYITVHSEQGRGTEFKIYLPSVLETPEPVVATEVAPGQRGIETILVVEDEPALREPVCRLLPSATPGSRRSFGIKPASALRSGPLSAFLTCAARIVSRC